MPVKPPSNERNPRLWAVELLDGIRLDRALSCGDIARRAAMPRRMVERILAGVTTEPTFRQLEAIAAGLELELDFLDPKTPPPERNRTP